VWAEGNNVLHCWAGKRRKRLKLDRWAGWAKAASCSLSLGSNVSRTIQIYFFYFFCEVCLYIFAKNIAQDYFSAIFLSQIDLYF